MKKLNKDISIIVIAKNEEFALPKCLESILRIGLKNAEIICVDSSSVDETLSIMKRYEKQYKNIKTYSAPNCKNAAMARNIGIKMASKSLLFFFDGDIEINKEFVLAAIEEFETTETGAVVGDIEEIVYNNKKKPVRQIKSRIGIKNKKV
jgi:glycosyltransferase involved in cell wall biosynthesis